MPNPFEKRATEYLHDAAAFLSVVTPEPLDAFFKKPAKDGSLFDRLCMVIGTPGSGKTTIATLLKFDTVHTLMNSPNHTEYQVLRSALSTCKIIAGNDIKVLACRIPMESEYRDFWELPYREETKSGLLKSFLQARAVILWLNGIRSAKIYDMKDIIIKYKDEAQVAKEGIGGETGEGILKKAIEIEKSIYEISAALVPPSEDSFSHLLKIPYQPFDAISRFIIREHDSEKLLELRPLIMLDDIHSLHSKQFFNIRNWLARREMHISRWLLMRLDAQTPEEVLIEGVSGSTGIDNGSNIKFSREITFIWLQSSEDRATNRRKFREMAKSMADKYLRLMPVFQKTGLSNFQNLLNSKPTPLIKSKHEKLKHKVNSIQKRYSISSKIKQDLESKIAKYYSSKQDTSDDEDVKLAMLLILLNRYVKRVPQNSLFEMDENIMPNKPLKVDSSVADGARIYLLHEFNRPYYYGIDALCDASAENAEQFLQLASALVSASEIRIIRNSASELKSDYQHKLLTEKAEQIVREWSFPKHNEVKKLCNYIAKECIAKSLEPNASLGGGANAFGIPDDEFELIPEKEPELAHIIKYGVAYCALSIKRRYHVKHKRWTLIELSGPFILSKGLTFTRGGFLEKEIKDLKRALE